MRQGRARFIVGFLFAPVLLYVVYVLVPYGQAFYFSLTDTTGFSPEHSFVGFTNYLELFKDTFGPVVAIYASLSDPMRRAELDEALLQFVARWNRGLPERAVEIPYEYLLVIARKPAA